MVNGVKVIDRTNRTERLQERVEVGTAVSTTRGASLNIFSNSETVAAANTATGIKGQANAEKIMGKKPKTVNFAKYSDSGKGQ